MTGKNIKSISGEVKARNGPLTDFEQVAHDEARKLSNVQEIMIRSTDYLRRIIAPVGGQGGVTMSYLCPIATVSPWKTTFGGSQEEKSTPLGGVRHKRRVIRLEATEQAFGRTHR